MSGAKVLFQTLTTSASARRRSRPNLVRTFGSVSATDFAVGARAVSNGPRSTPCHWAETRSRAERLPGPRGGMKRGGGRNIFLIATLLRNSPLGCGDALGLGVFVHDEHAVRLEVIIAGEGVAGEKVVHRFVKLEPHLGVLMVQQEVNVCAVLLAQADFDVVRHLEERVKVAKLAQPDDQVVVEMLVAERADVNGFAQAISVHRDGGTADIKILRVGGENRAL